MNFCRLNVLITNIRFYCNSGTVMKYLNVAEKNDAAKNIAGLLSRGTARKREGLSRYNKIYEFDANLFNQNTKMVMTSVSGHLMNYEFTINFRNWKSCNPVALFDAPIIKAVHKDYEPIKKTLEREIRSCNGLIVWTDCDREGENIGFEVIQVCRAIKPNIKVYRAKFSEITTTSVFRALNNLAEPDKNVSDAVDVRQEMDLRTGAAFTRLQTLHLSRVFPGKLAEKLISYGSCQFPTLGFVVERFKDIETFVPEPFWRIKMAHTKNDLTVEYTWDRDRLFAKNPCQSILDICQENPTATVESVVSKAKSKWRPVPLDTVEMEKIVSRKLKITAKETMRIAERLYTQGFISYPRTETNIFPQGLSLRPLVEGQTGDERWGAFANRILNEGGPTPRQGRKSDQAHPPIHPTKYAPGLTGNEQRLYEYIVRHFLACCHKDAQGHETIIKVKIAEEGFTAKGLVILERNYLDVYIYEKWNGKEIHEYREGETFAPSVLEMAEGSTTAPKLLTEADLIALMDKNGIGTDATHADHIDTIKTREYVGLHENIYFIPGTLGMGLVEGYDSIGLEVSLAKPVLRSSFEQDLKLICDGQKDPQIVLREQIQKYRAVFQNVIERMNLLEGKLAERIEEQPIAVQETESLPSEQFAPVLKCPKCGQGMVVRKRKNESGVFISCVGYPGCRNAIWLPGFVESIEVLDESCNSCGPDVKKIKVKFRPGQNPFFAENPKVLCIGGCDVNILETLDIALSSVIPMSNTTQNRPPSNLNQTQTNIRPAQNNTRPPQANTRPPQNNTRPSTNNTTWPSNSRTTTTAPDNTSRNNSPVSRPGNDAGNRTWIQPHQGLLNGPTTSGNVAQNNAAQLDVTCSCGISAVLLTVRKDGPNKGRLFYKCQKPTEAGGCNYFLWAPTDEAPPSSTNNSNSFTAPAPDATPQCNCGQPAVQRTVQKEGPNKGRQFYVCSGPMNSKCNFFQWSDADGANNSFSGGSDGGFAQGNNSWGGGYSGGNWGRGGGRGSKSSRGRGRGTKRKAPSNSGGGGKTRRKCGICGEEGHIRTNCPNANQ